MARLLSIGLDSLALRALSTRAAELALDIDARPADHAESAVETLRDVEGVLIGSVADPIRTIRRIQALAPAIPVIVVGSDRDCRAVKEAIRFNPLGGRRIECFADLEPTALAAGVLELVQRSRDQVRYHRTIGALNQRIAAPSPARTRTAAALLGRLLEVAPVGVVVTDSDANVREVNLRATQLLRSSEEAIYGRPLWEPFVRDEWMRIRGLLTRLNGDVAAQPRETFTIESPAGAARLEVTGAALNAASGGPGYLVVLHDTTERFELVWQLQEANRRKDEFLAMLGHELRNPLAPIRTAVELLRIRGHQGIDRERTTIERHVNHLVQLVDDLLDVSRITHGTIELRRRPIEVAAVIATAVEMASPLLDQRRHELHLAVARAGLVVDADASRLAQVISNLLMNAAKYTDPGGCIRIAARREDQHIAISVRDNGRGIAPDVLPRVFELFMQGRQALDRSAGGLGIGLAIVRSLVELHGGTVHVTSVVGEGTEFVVTLPPSTHASNTASSAPAAPHPSATGAAARARVLVVDDNEDAALLLAEVVVAFGYDVRVAHDGPSALRVAEAFRPDVALLDIGLPVMDGYDVARQLATMPGLDDVRLIAISGYGQAADKARTAGAGFLEHLVKPVNLEQLRSLLDDLFAAAR